MGTEVNLHVVQAYAAVETPALLKGILKVLTDNYCKGMSEPERVAYMKSVADDMNSYRDTIKELGSTGREILDE